MTEKKRECGNYHYLPKLEQLERALFPRGPDPPISHGVMAASSTEHTQTLVC